MNFLAFSPTEDLINVLIIQLDEKYFRFFENRLQTITKSGVQSWSWFTTTIFRIKFSILDHCDVSL